MEDKKNLDRSNLRQMILESPKQFKVGFELARGIKLPGDLKEVTISGVGGSALPGNILRIYLNDLFGRTSGKRPVSIYQNRFYKLPPESHNDCLNFICSYSGNTEETVSAFEEAIASNLPSVGISSGGKVEEMCLKNNIPHVKLPVPFANFPPRMATGYFFSVLFKIMANQGLVSDTTDELLKVVGNLESDMGKFEEKGRAIAKKLAGKTPVIYASTKYKSIAMIWKIKFNENAKTPSFWNFFPEVNHNEMLGFTLPQGKFFIIMLRDPEDHPRNKRRFEVTAKLLEDHGIETEIVDMEGDDVFLKTFGTMIIGDFASYYLALEYGQDPTPIDMVEELKVLLQK